MSGTKIGGQKAAKTNKKRHGKNFYKQIGKIGGQNSTYGAFAQSSELARLAGKIGGMRSRKDSKYTPTPEVEAEVAKIKARIAELKSL